MKVKNLTNKSQKLWIRDLLYGGSTPVEVLPGESREIAKNYMPDMNMTPNFSELFEVVTSYKGSKTIEEKEVETPTETAVDETESEGEEEGATAPAEPETNASTFICDICGAEFGSAQGLKMHMTRSHSSES